ncbi:MAG: DNA-binding response regulator, partial [Rubrivivax sp.]
MSRVLVVEDESAIAELIAINLRHAGYEVEIAV